MMRKGGNKNKILTGGIKMNYQNQVFVNRGIFWGSEYGKKIGEVWVYDPSRGIGRESVGLFPKKQVWAFAKFLSENGITAENKRRFIEAFLMFGGVPATAE